MVPRRTRIDFKASNNSRGRRYTAPHHGLILTLWWVCMAIFWASGCYDYCTLCPRTIQRQTMRISFVTTIRPWWGICERVGLWTMVGGATIQRGNQDDGHPDVLLCTDIIELLDDMFSASFEMYWYDEACTFGVKHHNAMTEDEYVDLFMVVKVDTCEYFLITPGLENLLYPGSSEVGQ